VRSRPLAKRPIARDVDGNGYADQLASTTDNSLAVAHNRTERTNLLREINRPLGASVTLDYVRAGNAVCHASVTLDSYYSRGLKSRELTADGAINPFLEIAHTDEFVGVGGAPACRQRFCCVRQQRCSRSSRAAIDATSKTPWDPQSGRTPARGIGK